MTTTKPVSRMADVVAISLVQGSLFLQITRIMAVYRKAVRMRGRKRKMRGRVRRGSV